MVCVSGYDNQTRRLGACKVRKQLINLVLLSRDKQVLQTYITCLHTNFLSVCSAFWLNFVEKKLCHVHQQLREKTCGFFIQSGGRPSTIVNLLMRVFRC